jgi:hypothetical protein
MNSFFYYSGIMAWIALGTGALLAVADVVIDWIINSLWTKREFLAFVWDRLKKKNNWRDPKIITKKSATVSSHQQAQGE